MDNLILEYMADTDTYIRGNDHDTLLYIDWGEDDGFVFRVVRLSYAVETIYKGTDLAAALRALKGEDE